MSSKTLKIFRTTCIFGLIVHLIAGCGLRIGEKAPEVAKPSHSGAGYDCLSRIPEHVDKYFSDQLNDQQISDFTICMQRAFVSFAQMTRGRDEKSYRPDEIRRFLQTYFLKDQKISDRLLNEMMIIKQALVGGSANRIARTELYSAVEILDDVRKEALRLRPHIRFLNPRLAKLADPLTLGAHLREANDALNESIKTFTGRLKTSPKGYTFEHLGLFMTEIRSFMKWEDHFKNANPVDSWVNFFKIFKELSAPSTDQTSIRAEDWEELLANASKWYLCFVQFDVGIKDHGVFQDVGLQNVVQFTGEIFQLVEKSISRQPGMTITFDQINRLTSALHGLAWIPEYIRLDSLNHSLKVLLERVFGDLSVAPGERRSLGLNLMNFSRLKERFYAWAYIQLQLDNRYLEDSNKGRFDLNGIPNLQGAPVFPHDVKEYLSELEGSEWDEFLKVKGKIRPLFADGSYRVTLAPLSDLSQLNTRHEFHNLSMMNLLRSVVSLIFAGYSSKNSRIDWSSGIQDTELQKFYSDFRNIGIDLGILDQRQENAGSRAFVEGNLFNYSADGLDAKDLSHSTLTFTESMELFAFLYSGGSMALDIYHALEAIPCEMDHLDLSGHEKISRKCVGEHLYDVLDPLIKNMPGLQRFLKSATPAIRQKYMKTILETAYSPKNSEQDWVELAELSTLAVVLHYAEAVLTRFDADNDGILVNNEVDAAIPIFRGFIKKFALDHLNTELSDSLARGAFYYILINKEMPLGYWDQWMTVPWKSYWSTGDVSLDRTELSMVFKVIIGRLFDTKVAEEGDSERQLIETGPDYDAIINNPTGN